MVGVNAALQDGVCFGLRVKAFAYAESAVSVWVMVAVKYRPVLED